MDPASSLTARPCVFCDTNPQGARCLERQTLFETGHWRVLMDYRPVTDGHLLIVPREHVVTRFDLTEAQTMDLRDVYARVNEIFNRIYPGCGILLYEKNGNNAWQHIKHFSIQAIPCATSWSLPIIQVKLIFNTFLSSLFSPMTDQALTAQKERLLKPKDE